MIPGISQVQGESRRGRNTSKMAVELLYLFLIVFVGVSGGGHSPSSPPSPPLECNYKIYENAIPYGEAKTDVIRTLSRTNTTQENCAELCCKVGPEVCQYAWLFGDRCYAVACHHNKTLCQPTRVIFNSTYMRIRISKDNEVMDGKETVPTTESSQTSSKKKQNGDQDSQKKGMSTSDSPTEEESNHKSSTTPSFTSSTSSPFDNVTPLPPSSGDTEIQVAVDGNKVVTLPKNKAKVFASTWPPENTHFVYQWEQLFGPSEGKLSGVDKPILTMSKLVVGVYGLKLTVHDTKHKYKDGRAYVNITVLQAPHKNQPPVVSILPASNFTVSYPASSLIILDASETSDDRPISELKFHWELVVGPLKGLKHAIDPSSSSKASPWDQPLLKLVNVPPGDYQLKVTVTDAQGAFSKKIVIFSVLPAKDYPPTANAGQAVVVHLPKTEVTLDGSKSSDDKGIKSYLWMVVKGKGCDIQGSSTATPVVSNLHQGVYEFKLTVTDGAEQKSSATVLVDVVAEQNQPPVSDAGSNVTVLFPVTTAILNGSLSHDEYRIEQYKWTLISGPTDVQLVGDTTAILEVSGLHVAGSSPTLYEFNLTVTDYGNLTSSSTTFIIYNKNDIIPPSVNAGRDITITLPQSTVILNASAHDGFGIVSYQWYRSESSPAAGSVVGTSDHTPMLMLTNLVPGVYNFTFEVVNVNKVKNSDSLMLTVLKDFRNDYIVELFLNEDIQNFTQKNLDDLKETLVITLKHLQYSVNVVSVLPHRSHILIQFTVALQNTHRLVNGTEVVELLTRSGPLHMLGNFHVSGIESKVCHNPCSGRGYCDTRTKQCKCDTFWMENPFTAYFGKKTSNCDWSLFYLVLVAVGIILLQVVAVWLCCCCCMRRRKAARRKRFKYAILSHKKDNGHMLTKSGAGYSKTSLMVSETDTEEEVLFDSHKRNGYPQTTPIEQ